MCRCNATLLRRRSSSSPLLLQHFASGGAGRAGGAVRLLHPGVSREGASLAWLNSAPRPSRRPSASCHQQLGHFTDTELRRSSTSGCS
jgi:hypothetical protein